VGFVTVCEWLCVGVVLVLLVRQRCLGVAGHLFDSG
jgi:hypothetical protein